jgi:hypothetical protein
MGRKSLQAVRRTQILDACEEIVLEEGLASASPAWVAGRVGLDRTTLHHYFRTRSELLGSSNESSTGTWPRSARCRPSAGRMQMWPRSSTSC